MGKRKGKIDVSSEKSWGEILGNYDINSENFNCETFLMIESSSGCLPITNELCKKIGRTRQARIRAITYENLEKLALGGTFVEDLEFDDIIKEAKEELLQKHVLSTKTLALLIKLQIFTIRKRYLNHKDNFYKLEKQLEQEKKIFLEFEEKSEKKQWKATKNRPKKTIKNDKITCETINTLSELPSDEIKRIMRESGESENFIGPFEGVDLYFILSRIYDHNLPTELTNVGINLTAIIDFSDNPKDFSTKVYHRTLFENFPKNQLRTTDISNFWANFSAPKTVCYLRYCPRETSEVYDDIIRIAYNITALKRLHQDYLDSMKVFDVEEPGPPVKITHMKTYQMILKKVPNEHQTAPVILHALLEELSNRLHLEPPKDALKIDKDPQPSVRSPKDSGHNVKKNFKQFHQNTAKPPMKATVTVHKTKVLQYGDVLEYQLSHLPYSNDLKQINLQALKITEPLQLFKNFPKIQEGQERYYDYLFQKWATKYNYTPTNRLKHCLHAYYLAHGTFQTPPPPSITPKPPLSDLLFQNYKPYNTETSPEVYLNLLSSLYTQSINKNCTKERFYCEHIEEYDSSTMIQMINVAYTDLGQFEYKYLSAHDTILLRFHPRPGLEKKVQEIRTPVCFRDFCAHIVDMEIEWLIEQERKYWERKKKQKEEKLVSISEVYILKENDFIRPGSIKDRLLKEENEVKKIILKKNKSNKTPEGSASTSSQQNNKSIVKSKNIKMEIVVVKDDKKKVFQGYNLGSNYTELRSEKNVYKTFDGITLSLEKDQFFDDLETFCVKVVFRDNSILFHGRIKDSLLDINPFIFHIHVSNGIIMGFGPASSPKDVPSKRNILATSPQKPRKSPNFKKLQTKAHEKLLTEISNKEYRRTKRVVLEKLKTGNHGPVFKICSLSLRGHKHVKRTKCHQEFSIGIIVKRLFCKPKLRMSSKRKFLVSKRYQKGLPYDFKATLPTGLCVQAMQGTKEQPFYIRQGYMIDRNDLESIEHEDYRCCFKGTVVSFLKNGEVVKMAASTVLETRKFGYFNLEETHESKKDRSCDLHKAMKDTAEMGKNIQAFYQDRQVKSRMESRKGCPEAKRFKIPKNLYQTGYLPVMKLTTVTEDGRKMVAMNNFIEEKDKYFTVTYNDYLHRKTLKCRQDGTSWFLDNEARATTQFKDKTRITTWPVLLDENFQEGSYVLYGLNYKYEHPNYMTVIELCDEQSVTIEMPEVVVRILQEGTFQVVLHGKETIFVDENISLIPKSCNCGCLSSGVNIQPFVDKKGVFLKLFDKDNIVTIDYSGSLNKTPCSSRGNCDCPKTILHRFFALKRDLSGAELFLRPTDPRFIHTMTDFQTNPKYSPKNPPISIRYPLKKTFSENFMMLYDTPFLGACDGFEDAEEIACFFDYKEKDLIVQRTPIFIYERNIERLQLHLVLETIVSGFFAVLNRDKKWRIFKPPSCLINFLKEHDEDKSEDILKPPSPKKPKTPRNRRKSLKDVIEDTRELRSQPIPSYFKSKKGSVVTFLIECVNRAMDLSDHKLEEPRVEEESSYEIKKTGLSPTSCSSTDSEIFLNLIEFENRTLSCNREACDCIYKKPCELKDYEEKKPVVVKRESWEEVRFNSPDLSDICSESSACYLESSGTSTFSRMVTLYLHEKTIQGIAFNIIKALIEASDKNDLTLSSSQIKIVVQENVKNLNLTSDIAIAIVQEMEQQMLHNIQDEKPVYNAAMSLIKEIKNEISQFTTEDFTDYNHQLLQNVSVKASAILYDALEEESSIPKAVKAVKSLLEDAKLSLHGATLVLDMAARGLEDDIIGKSIRSKISNIVGDIDSGTAFKIIHTTEDILKYQESNRSLPALLFDDDLHSRPQLVRIKSDINLLKAKREKSKKHAKGKHAEDKHFHKKSVLFNASIDFIDREESHDKVREKVKVKRFASVKK